MITKADVEVRAMTSGPDHHFFGYHDNTVPTAGGFYSPPEITGELRCDLHPRWSRDGRHVCFDSVHEGARQMYSADVSNIVCRPAFKLS